MSDDPFCYPEICVISTEGKNRQWQKIPEESKRPSSASVSSWNFSSLHSFPSQCWELFVAPHGEPHIYVHCPLPFTGEKRPNHSCRSHQFLKHAARQQSLQPATYKAISFISPLYTPSKTNNKPISPLPSQI